jgi:hypothetical protein
MDVRWSGNSKSSCLHSHSRACLCDPVPVIIIGQKVQWPLRPPPVARNNIVKSAVSKTQYLIDLEDQYGARNYQPLDVVLTRG